MSYTMYKTSLSLFLFFFSPLHAMDIESCPLMFKESSATLDAVYANNAKRVLAALKHERTLLEGQYVAAMVPKQQEHRANIDKILGGAVKHISVLKQEDREFHEKELQVRAWYINQLKKYAFQTLPFYEVQAHQQRERTQSICNRFFLGGVCLVSAFFGDCLPPMVQRETSRDLGVKENQSVLDLLKEFKDMYTQEIRRLEQPRIIPDDEN